MTDKCFDDGTIQAFLDSELDQVRVEQISRHVAVCDDCAVAIAVAERELAATYGALDLEFDTLVPSRRLWAKINQAIVAGDGKVSWLNQIAAFISSPTSVAFAGLIIVFAVLFGLYGLKAGNTGVPVIEQARNDRTDTPPTTIVAAPFPEVADVHDVSSPDSKETANNDYRLATADYRTKPKGPDRRSLPEGEPKSEPAGYAPSATLVGEESYVRTIETLERSVDGRKDAALGPSARFAFEKDMAVATSTITMLKDEVRRDPKNETARELLRSTYQNKINLLNSVAEKSELMASLK